MSPLIIKFMVLPWLAKFCDLSFAPAPPARGAGWAVGLSLVSMRSASFRPSCSDSVQIELGDSGLSLELLNRLLEPIRSGSLPAC